MNRADHLKWAKERALPYARSGDKANCIASMASDLGKHPDTAESVAIVLVTSMHLSTSAQLVDWVEGFN